MEITFNTEEDFSPHDREVLCKKLGINDTELDGKLCSIANAAFYEYKTMILEHGIPATISELREERLAGLIRCYFKRIPRESEIRPIFQLTATSCKTLLKNTITKNEMLFEDIVKAEIQPILCLPGKEKVFRLEIKSELIVQLLNNKITEKNPGLQKIQLLHGTAGIYECPDDTMNFLKKEYL
jgi:hypothetical protein